MSKSIKIFSGIYIAGCVIGMLALLSSIFYSSHINSPAAGVLEGLILIFISGPFLLIGLVGSILTMLGKHLKKEVLSQLDRSATTKLVVVSILIVAIQIIGDKVGWW